MCILVLLWVGTLSVIYTSSYLEMKNQNNRMLKAHAEMYTLQQTTNYFPTVRPRPNGSPNFNSEFDSDSPKFKLSTFYSVAVSYEGEILDTKNNSPAVHTDDDLGKLAQHIINGEKTSGKENNLAYYKVDKGGYILVAFMDNTVVNESAMTLFRYTLIFGAVAMILFFFVSVFLAKKIVKPLEESYQKQKQFISDAGHELKTPVSVVSANAELLSRELGENQWLQNIQYENERMGTLVSQLLQLARTENVTPQMEHVDLSRLIFGEALPFESVVFEKGLMLKSNIKENICVCGDKAQLKQVVSILLDNAIAHSKENGEIQLNLTKEHGFATLSVINCGDEIPLEECHRIFERFYRVDKARGGDDKHYGLGLAIAKAIVASHKGHIEAFCYDGLVEFRVQIPTL